MTSSTEMQQGKYNTDKPQGQAAGTNSRTSSKDMQYGHAAHTHSTDMQHGPAARTSSINI